MRKLTLGIAAIATVFATLPVAAHATGTTTGEDTVSTVEPSVPTECIQYYMVDVGPSRAVHSAARPGIVIDAPDCEDIEGLCVEVVFPTGGPNRAPHAIDTTTAPCEPAGPACDIVVEAVPFGPARMPHQAAGVTRPERLPFVVVEIPQACQDVLSGAAIPTTGSDSSNIIWLGAVLVGLGTVLVTTRRVATARTR